MPAGEGLIKSGDAQRCGFVSGLIGCGVQVIEQCDLLLLPQQCGGMEIQGHGDLAALGVISVDLEVHPGQLQLQRRIGSLRNAFNLHDLGERKLSGGRTAVPLSGTV